MIGLSIMLSKPGKGNTTPLFELVGDPNAQGLSNLKALDGVVVVNGLKGNIGGYQIINPHG